MISRIDPTHRRGAEDAEGAQREFSDRISRMGGINLVDPVNPVY
jgi:hypothetical protein